MLKFTVLLLIVAAVAVSATPKFRHRYQLNALLSGKRDVGRGGRIVGGRDTDISEVPHQIGLHWRRFHICGGSIITVNRILTAVHCTYGDPANEYQILAGQTNINHNDDLIQVSALWEHPLYDDWTIEYDIAVMALERDIVPGPTKNVISLPPPNFHVTGGNMALVSGWGDLESGARNFPDILQSVFVPVLTNAQCQAIYPQENILEQHICAGAVGSDACQGDSGGPLTYQNFVVGVVSWGYGCAQEWPTVYARVSEFLPFITQHLN